METWKWLSRPVPSPASLSSLGYTPRSRIAEMLKLVCVYSFVDLLRFLPKQLHRFILPPVASENSDFAGFSPALLII